MRVVLVGWDGEAVPLAALNDLGLDVVLYTRWHEGEPLREVRGGVRIERCPHAIGGGAEAEADSLGQAILARDLEYGLGAGAVEVIHTLDATAWRAAGPLAERHPRASRVVTVSTPAANHSATVLIADHPIIEEDLRATVPPGGPRIVAVPTAPRLAEGVGGRGDVFRDGQRVVTVWLPRARDTDPLTLASPLERLLRESPDLSLCVLGQGPQAERLARLLASRGRLVRPATREALLPEASWNAVVSRSSVLGLVGSDPATDPAAWASWSAGVPVVRLDGETEAVLAALRDAVAGGERTERALSAGRILSQHALDAPAVAHRLLGAYLDAMTQVGRSAPETTVPAITPAMPTRLDVIAVGPREAYATWHLRPTDRARALAWLGEDAARAALVLRVHDITARHFHGHDPHGSWDIEVSSQEHGRGIRLDAPGLSLAVSLGLRGASGACLPLAYAPLVHLPRDEPAEFPPDRRLRALGRASDRDALQHA